ncbi:tRNA-specific 2-thiouridylase MnmA-like isoform X2 [Gordionus sp. m RMFG-2023]|uniref:tRNA-specific 2-thiouridylase MnmA-like isoform X2 n=1 Tax=Gordionus sp. m RMFG-2023 TaxID=3053472 RepID=UPI0031FBFB06
MPALDDYKQGYYTPNPDILCNSEIKFGCFLNYCINVLKVDAVATGHYASNSWDIKKVLSRQYDSNLHILERPRLIAARDIIKDQTFFLSNITEKALSKCIFPLSNLTKDNVRAIAKKTALAPLFSKKAESMGMCFVGKRTKFDQFLAQYYYDFHPVYDKYTGDKKINNQNNHTKSMTNMKDDTIFKDGDENSINDFEFKINEKYQAFEAKETDCISSNFQNNKPQMENDYILKGDLSDKREYYKTVLIDIDSNLQVGYMKYNRDLDNKESDQESTNFVTIGQRIERRRMIYANESKSRSCHTKQNKNVRYYVVRKDLAENIIYVSSYWNHPSLYSTMFTTLAPHWINGSIESYMTKPGIMDCFFRHVNIEGWFPCRVNIDLSSPNVKLNDYYDRLKNDTTPEHMLVELKYPSRAITPGQYAVFYKDSVCLGNARISRALPKAATYQNLTQNLNNII